MSNNRRYDIYFDDLARNITGMATYADFPIRLSKSMYKDELLPYFIREQKEHTLAVIRKLEGLTHQSQFRSKFTADGSSRDTVFVAGGAPRDWEHGLIAKDIDIYMYPQGIPTGSIRQFLRNLFGSVIDLGEDYGDAQTSSFIRHVFEFSYKGTKINLILTTAKISHDSEEAPVVENILGTFDLGICKIAIPFRIDPHTELIVFEDTTIRSPEYDEDCVNRTITVMDGHDPDSEHVRRVMNKYPAHKLVVKTITLGQLNLFGTKKEEAPSAEAVDARTEDTRGYTTFPFGI